MRRRAAALALALVLTTVLGAGACGAEPRPSPAAPPPEAGSHFVGRVAGGVGASVDFLGFDAASRAVGRALAAAGVRARVAIASLVNAADEAVPLPRFVGVDRAGEPVPLVPAGTVLAGLGGPEARRARAAIREPPKVPAEGGAVVYLVLRGHDPAALRELRMRTPAGPTAALKRIGG